ncbi:hypothetical protein BT96DRAFT_257677 [Gymnopus androsaceus JB14]|uniref:Uncharacterized protein n=1 Tax=Gymnopus androsaceus JB14 TaxID=1447944 RepID=A0A6A4H6T3_9AGAR|nr:hypothetical protein BT96DRAFT_257677 [Gymnopus androsaceus JB14]
MPTPFTASLTASFFGLDLNMKGYLSDFPIMSDVLRRLGTVRLHANCIALVQFDRQRLLRLEVSGRVGDVQSIVGALERVTRKSQYIIHSLFISVPMLFRREEFSNFLSALSTQAPDLQNLTIKRRPNGWITLRIQFTYAD